MLQEVESLGLMSFLTFSHVRQVHWKQLPQANPMIRSGRDSVRFCALTQDFTAYPMSYLVGDQQFDLLMGLLEAAVTGEIEDPKNRENAIKMGFCQPNGAIVPNVKTALLDIASQLEFQKRYIFPKLAPLADTVTGNNLVAGTLIKVIQEIYHLEKEKCARSIKSLVFEYKLYSRLSAMGIVGKMLPYTLNIYSESNPTLLVYQVMNQVPFLMKDPLLIQNRKPQTVNFCKTQELETQSTPLSDLKTEDTNNRRNRNMSVHLAFTPHARQEISSQLGVSDRTQFYLDQQTGLIYRPLNGIDLNPRVTNNVFVPFTTLQQVGKQVQMIVPGKREPQTLDRIG